MRRKKTRREESAIVITSQGEERDLLDSFADQRAGFNPEQELERVRLSDRIQNALDVLSPRERMVFELKHYQGLRLRAIGEMLNTSEETAKNTLFRATRKLRGQLSDLR
jgi:RNA polymerase sigma-70 factor (ECF subfamily)